MQRRCGGCGAAIVKDEPMQVWTIGSLKKLRCVLCVGPAPPDLPADLGETRDPFFQRRLDRLANRLPLDWLDRAVREPGEDDE
jgi:hypothetical protein